MKEIAAPLAEEIAPRYVRQRTSLPIPLAMEPDVLDDAARARRLSRRVRSSDDAAGH